MSKDETKTTKPKVVKNPVEVAADKPLAHVLNLIQKELKAPKSQHNDFGNYYYRNCEDILEAIKPLLPEGCFVMLTDMPLLVGEWHYIEVQASLVRGDERITATAVARESVSKKGMDDAQVTGSTSSYARKYAMNGLFAIDDSRDSDTTNVGTQQTATPSVTNKQTTAPSATTPATAPTQPNTTAPSKPTVMSVQQQRLIFMHVGRTGTNIEQFKAGVRKKYGLESFNDLTTNPKGFDIASALIRYLEAKPSAEKPKEPIKPEVTFTDEDFSTPQAPQTPAGSDATTLFDGKIEGQK